MVSSNQEVNIKEGIDSDLEEQQTIRKVAFASFFGNFIEWFDYGSYLYFASIIADVFFPQGDKNIHMLQTFGIFAISFFFRPIGAVVWGTLGDKKGRRWALIVSILIMSGATTGIGLVPSYETIGILAPILLLLLRLLQGFSASGEYAGAATFLAEYAPKEKRGIYCSLVPASTAAGLLLGSTCATILMSIDSSSALHGWGWRIPFIAALPLGIMVLYMRLQLEDSPTYAKLQEKLAQQSNQKQISPFRLLFIENWKEAAIAFGVASLNAVGFYMVLTYLPTFLESEVKIPGTTSHIITDATLVVYILTIFGMGHLSDSYGRKKMLIAACIAFIVFTIPAFMLLTTGKIWVIVLVEIFLCTVLTINDGTLSSFLTESFPTEVRYTGFALSFNMANVIFGGTAPLIATGLISFTGDSLAPAYYLVFVAVLALGAMIASKDHSNKDLSKM